MKLNTVLRHFRNLQQSASGSVAILVGLGVFLFIIAAGAAVDMARAQILRSKIQSALDASGLAAGAALSNVPTGYTDAQWVQIQAQKFFDLNFPPGYLGTTPITVNTAVTNDGTMVELSASSTQSTSFMKFVGINDVTVGANAKVMLDSAGQGLELVLSLDNTGSMKCDVSNPSAPCDGGPNSKIAALRTAAASLVNILYGGSETATGLFVGVVPFSQAVNIGQDHKDWLHVYYNPITGSYYNSGQDAIDAFDWGPGGTWGGCVMTQGCWGGWKASNFNPIGCPFRPYWYAPEPATSKADADALTIDYGYYWNWNPAPASSTPATWRITGWRDDSVIPSTYLSPLNTNERGPNLGCPQELTEMTAAKSTVLSAISTMTATGDTIIPEGVVWAWRLLAPRWRPYWGGEMATNNLPLDYNTPTSRKVVVLMSDGWNNLMPYNYSAYGFVWEAQANILGAYYGAPANETLDYITNEICDGMKRRGITIYTIGFGNVSTIRNAPSTVNAPLLQSCATSSQHFFLAPTNAELQAVFKKIGKELSNLRVSQ